MWKYYIFSLSLFCRGILFSLSFLPHLPTVIVEMTRRSGFEEWWEEVEAKGGIGRKGNGPPQLNVSGSSMAAGYQCTAANKFDVIP